MTVEVVEEDVKREVTSRNLKCLLDETELAERGLRLARLVDDEYSAEQHKKEVTADATSKLQVVKNDVQKMSRIIRDRAEWRDVECEEIWDYQTKRVVVVRLDTGEQVESRPMTTKELQRDLPGTGDALPFNPLTVVEEPEDAPEDDAEQSEEESAIEAVFNREFSKE